MLFLGLAPADLPAFGGAFLVDPSPLVSFPITIGGTPGVAGDGELFVPLGTDLSWALGFDLYWYWQAVFADPAGPTGKTLSNGARLAVQ